MQFNRRVFRVEIENRLHTHNLYNLSVQGVFDPQLVYHPNSSVLINDPPPFAESAIEPPSQPSTSAAAHSSPPVQASRPLSPPAAIKSPEGTAPILSVIKILPNAKLPKKNENSFAIDIFAPIDFQVPPNSSYDLDLGFAIIAPQFFTLKIENQVENKHIFLQNIVASCNFHKPIVLSFLNIHPTQAFYILAETLIASVTCHRTLPNQMLLVDTHLFQPFETTNLTHSVASDEPQVKKKNST